MIITRHPTSTLALIKITQFSGRVAASADHRNRCVDQTADGAGNCGRKFRQLQVAIAG